MSDPTPDPAPAVPLDERMEQLATGLTNLAEQYRHHGSIDDAALSLALESINDLIRCGEFDVNHRDAVNAALRMQMAQEKVARAGAIYAGIMAGT